MHEHIIDLALIVVLGIAAQWLAWQLRLPSILLLLTFGFVAGPVTHMLDPDRLFSDLLFPFVSLAVQPDSLRRRPDTQVFSDPRGSSGSPQLQPSTTEPRAQAAATTQPSFTLGF